MFKSSLKRSRNDFLSLTDRLNQSTDYSQNSHLHEQDSSSFAPRKPARFMKDFDPLLDIPPISSLQTVEKKSISIRRVPENLLGSTPESWVAKEPNISPLFIDDMTYPSNVGNLLKDISTADAAKLGTKDRLCWIYLDKELLVWSLDRTGPAVPLTVQQPILAVAFGRIRGVIYKNNTEIEVFAIATPNKIRLYNYAELMIEELNVSLSTNNELVNWIAVRDSGIYFGGSQGTLKMASCFLKTGEWKIHDSELYPMLKNPQFYKLFMSKAIKQVEFLSGDVAAYCLVEKQYGTNWLCRKFLWQCGSNTQKQIQIYSMIKEFKLAARISEFRIIQTLRHYYSELNRLPLADLRIQNIFMTSDRTLGICLKSGIFFQLTNIMTIQTLRPSMLVNPKQPRSIYETLAGPPINLIEVNPNSNVNVGTRLGTVMTSLGLNNMTVYAEPTYFAVTTAERSVDCLFPNIITDVNDDKPNKKEKTIDPLKLINPKGKIVELQRRVSGSKLDGQFDNSVFEARREWMYLHSNSFKVLTRLRLLDKTLVMLRIHSEIAAQQLASVPNPTVAYNLQKSMIDYINTFGVVNVCMCLLEIVLNRSISILVPEEIYINTYNSCIQNKNFWKKIPQKPLGPRHMENTLEIKAFAQQMFDSVSRQVLATKQTQNIYFCNLMGKTDGQQLGTNADIMWHCYIRYFQTLFSAVKNEKMDFFRKERELTCFVREKLELFRRYLIRKQSNVQEVHLNMVYKRPPAESGFEWIQYKDVPNTGKINDVNQQQRFPVENTGTLLKYLIPTIQKINTLLELFERFDMKGDNDINIYLSLTNPKVAGQVRKMILGRYKVGDAYLDELQRILPQIVSMPDIIFEQWANMPMPQQNRIDLKQAIVDLDEDRLETVKLAYEKIPGGLARFLDLLLYRFDNLEDQLRKLNEAKIYSKNLKQGNIQSGLLKKESEDKYYQRDVTINTLQQILVKIVMNLKSGHKAQDLNLLDTLVRQIRAYIENIKIKEANRIVPESQKSTIKKGYLKLENLVRNIIQSSNLAELSGLLPEKTKPDTLITTQVTPPVAPSVSQQSRAAPFR